MTMRYRILGGTGIEVSVHCVGAMMFGAAGNPDQAIHTHHVTPSGRDHI